jgi:hypothetical protein
MNLNKRELAMILHALRKTQREVGYGTDLSQCLHFGPEGIKPLTSDEIDNLCMRLNTNAVLAPLVLGEQKKRDAEVRSSQAYQDRQPLAPRLYRVTITRTEPSRRELIELVVRAPLPKDAKGIAVDELCEMWPKGSKMSGIPVELSVDELVEPENHGWGYCYPVKRAPRVFRYTFK